MPRPVESCHTDGVRLPCVIVDDNESFLEVARSVLERQGMAVVGVATTGAEAVRQARELRPESGYDIARLLAGHVGNVIMISVDDRSVTPSARQVAICRVMTMLLGARGKDLERWH
jgi:CheY-like chemotaxis protein